MKIIFLTASAYSGTTFLSLLLNTHSQIATNGHLRFKPRDEFRCSCGVLVSECQYFRGMKETFAEKGLPFAYDDFGLGFDLTGNRFFNRRAIGSLSFLSYPLVEKGRDFCVERIPSFRKKLKVIRERNLIYVEKALSYFKAEYLLDNGHSPYVLRQLRRNKAFQITALHLIRNPLNVVAASVRIHGKHDVKTLMKVWLNHNEIISRISKEVGGTLFVRYEDLCLEPESELTRLYAGLNLEAISLREDFKSVEHHVLGNNSRMGEGKIIYEPKKWERTLSNSQVQDVRAVADRYMRKRPDSALTDLLHEYLN